MPPIDMPPQPPTTRLPAPSPVEIAIAKLAASVDQGFLRMSQDISLVSSDLGIVKDRVTLLETERAKFSGGVRALSTSDGNQSVQIAALTASVDGLSKSQELQLAILGRLDRVVANPSVKIILGVLAMAAASWAATKGLK